MVEKNTAPTATAAKPKRAKKPPSAARLAAMAAVEVAVKQHEAAKSPQEKTLAESRLKDARDALKSLKFTEIAAPRIRRAIDVLRQLENVANPNAYKWTNEQAEKAAAALQTALGRFEGKLFGVKKKDAEKFSF